MRGAGDAGDSSTSIISFFSDKKGSFKSWPRTSGENSSRNSVKCCGDKKAGESLCPCLSVMPTTEENRSEQFYMCTGHPCQSAAGSTSPNNLLVQSLLQAEELQLEQKSSQRHTLQQKSLSLKLQQKWKTEAWYSCPEAASSRHTKGTHYSATSKMGKHISPRQSERSRRIYHLNILWVE